MSKQFIFGNNPVLKKSRSKFNLNQPYKTSMMLGDICPVYLQEVYPGDSFKVDTTFLLRTPSPFIKVPMDNLFMDIAFYWVPNRLVFDHWEELMGENKTSEWIPNVTYSVPQVNVNIATPITAHTVADYFGIPPVCKVSKLNALPFRAFALIYNYWYRDENIISPVLIQTGTTDGTINSNAWASNNYLGLVPKACKLHDYFTTCLPGTQKGTAPSLPIEGKAVVKTDSTQLLTGTQSGLILRSANNSDTFTSGQGIGINSVVSGSSQKAGYVGGVNASGMTTTSPERVYPANLYADLTQSSITSNINDLRLVAQIQKLYELDARGGTRYPESILSHFGVGAEDVYRNLPQFLGGKRVPINITQVNQTSSSDSTGKMADVSGYSLSNGHGGFSKSFTEHGFIIGVAIVRQFHTYQQGVERFFTRTGRLDFYDPLFAHLGEQAVYKKEIYAGDANTINQVFGYQEAYADLRHRPAKITGLLNSDRNNNMDVWHFGDDYANTPVLNPSFINETNTYLNRTLTTQSDFDCNFIVDFYHKSTAIRVLPTYGTPGIKGI